MKHLFVPYELALLAKEKGFNENCLGYFDEQNNLRMGLTYFNSSKHAQAVAPLYQQLVDWFDEVYNIRIDWQHSESTGKYKYAIRELIDGKWVKQFNATSEFTKEERNLKSLQEAFKLI
jgi:hypothetical protein